MLILLIIKPLCSMATGVTWWTWSTPKSRNCVHTRTLIKARISNVTFINICTECSISSEPSRTWSTSKVWRTISIETLYTLNNNQLDNMQYLILNANIIYLEDKLIICPDTNLIAWRRILLAGQWPALNSISTIAFRTKPTSEVRSNVAFRTGDSWVTRVIVAKASFAVLNNV